MTIKEMIQTLQKLANNSENGMDTKVLFQDEEWGETNISEMYVTAKETVLIVGE